MPFWEGVRPALLYMLLGVKLQMTGVTINFRYIRQQGGPNPFTSHRAVKLGFPSPPASFPSFFLFFYQTLLITTRYSLLLSKNHVLLKRRTNSFLGRTYGSGTDDQRKRWGLERDRIRCSTLSGIITYFLLPLASDPFVPSPSSSGLRLWQFYSRVWHELKSGKALSLLPMPAVPAAWEACGAKLERDCFPLRSLLGLWVSLCPSP